MQCPDATLVTGFRTWEKEFNRHVKKGEKAIRILAPIQRKGKKIEKDEDGNEIEVEFKYNTFKAVPVFDVQQTDGAPVKTLANKLTGEEGAELIDRLIKVSPVPVVFKNFAHAANGYFSDSEGLIVVKDSNDTRQKVKTLVHEIAHSLLHGKGGEEQSADRCTREVQAESVAYVVLNYLGIDSSEYSFGYVAGWSSDKDTKELQASLEVIRKTAAQIIDSMAA